MSSLSSLPLAPDCAETISLTDSIQHASAGVGSRVLLQTPELRVVRFAFAAGQELALHTSRRRALVQILEGECDFFFGGSWQRLTAGTVLHLPPLHPHAVKAAVGAFSMLLTLGAEAAPAPSRELDVRGLEPPEPLVRILAALETLPAGQTLAARTDREPCHLFGEAAQRGFRHESRAQADGSWITTLAHR